MRKNLMSAKMTGLKSFKITG